MLDEVTTLNPVFFGFFSIEESSASLSSEPRTRAAVFFLGVFFLTGALFLLLPPLVGRARLSSSAWSLAASAASASTLGSFRLFLGGDPFITSDTVSLVASRFTGLLTAAAGSGDGAWKPLVVGAGVVASSVLDSECSSRALKMSKRSSIKPLMAAYTASVKVMKLRIQLHVAHFLRCNVVLNLCLNTLSDLLL
jgi:hypothetical protein